MTLDLDALEALIGERTRVVAFTLASNAVGSLPDPARIAAAAHAAGALAWADGVHMAPHRRLRARELGLDVLLCSPYKFFGPHLGMAAIRPDLAESLPADRVRPAGEDPPGHRFETGTQSLEAVAGATAAVEYLRALGDGDLDVAFPRSRSTRRARAALPGGLPDGIQLYGIRGAEARTPRSASTSTGRRPRAVAEVLGRRELYVWDGDYYALEPMRALGMDDSGGAVRAGFLHYTTEDEVDRLLGALGRASGLRAALRPRLRSPAARQAGSAALPGMNQAPVATEAAPGGVVGAGDAGLGH